MALETATTATVRQFLFPLALATVLERRDAQIRKGDNCDGRHDDEHGGDDVEHAHGWRTLPFESHASG